MKTKSELMVWVLGLGVMATAGVSMKAQETGAGAAPGAVTAPMDNGAMPGDSHVRIVRLSSVQGTLALDRKTGLGFEQTMQNMPIIQGQRLRTEAGYAEVEFEDNSTLRLAPDSEVDFPLLAMRSSGAKASTMNVVKGTVYVTTESTKDNEFLLEAGQAKIVVPASTHLRLDFDGESALLSVFKGSVQVQRGSDTSVVNKKETLSLSTGEMTIAKKIAEESYDAWDKQSMDYHEAYSRANSFAGGGNSFGLSDLNYYGNFVNVPGYGSFWQPYLVGSGWSPYGNGVWAMYPGAGYSWVSPYPWGWLPYHSGGWSFVPGLGWGWQPGGAWNGLNNVAYTGGQPVGVAGVGAGAGTGTTGLVGGKPVHSPLRAAVMPQAPSATGAVRQSLVLSSERPIVMSKESTPGNFVFQRDSAGLGVPRGSLGNLNHISHDVGRHGSANMEVYAAAPEGRMNGANHGVDHGVDHGASRGPATLRPAEGGMGRPEGSMGERGASSASRQGGYGGSGGASGAQAPAARSGGASQPMSSPAPMSSPSAGGGAAPSTGARSPK